MGVFFDSDLQSPSSPDDQLPVSPDNALSFDLKMYPFPYHLLHDSDRAPSVQRTLFILTEFIVFCRIASQSEAIPSFHDECPLIHGILSILVHRTVALEHRLIDRDFRCFKILRDDRVSLLIR